MNFIKIITAICSVLFLMIGFDKFYPFMEPPCSLMDNISPVVWKVFGVLQLSAGILIWVPAFKKYIAGFFMVFMLIFTIYHLIENTYDIGGAVFMTLMLGILVWDPSFLRGKKK